MARIGFLVAALLLTGPAFADEGSATVKSGVEKWTAGDSAGAVAIWQPFAAQGDADAAFNMGQAYKLGRGVAKDPVKARDYYRQAATKGHLPAQANLGILLFQAGEKPEAMRWLKAAADKGETRAQYVFGIATFNGDGTPRNLGLAYGYLLRASAQGLSQATSALASLGPSLSPVDRANGEAVSASLAAGQGIPTALVTRPLPPLTRNETLKQPPSGTLPVQTAPVTPPIVNATPPPVAVKATPVVVQPKPAPVVAEPLKVAVPKPDPAPALVAPPKVEPAPVAAPKPDAVEPKPMPVEVKAVPVPTAAPPVIAPPVAAPKPVIVKPAPAKVVPPVAKPLPEGWRVQLGAFSKRSLADEAWAAIKREQKDAIGTAKPLFDADGPVVKLQLGPYPTKTAARDACAKLAFAGRACFVTGG